MAEYMIRARLGRGSHWTATSAGLFASYGTRASPEAVQVMSQNGLDLRSHLSRPITRELVDAANVIVVMTAAHRDQLVVAFPEAKEKVFLLRSFDPRAEDADIRDPFGLAPEAYRRAYKEMDAALPELLSFLHDLEIGGGSVRKV
jgi:protein-tyrosine-phosphatase